jgi:hypothetical protein
VVTFQESAGGDGIASRGTRDPVEERNVREIQRAAERVCALILYSDLPLIDIKIAAADLRRLCARLAPDRAYLYDWIYARRFRRLWEQWRSGERWS